MEERTYKVAGSREWNGVLPGEHVKVKVGDEPGADITEGQAEALVAGGHLSPSKAQSAKPLNLNAGKEE